MSTVHNKAAENDFAPVVLMPGDPLRAKFIAENFLTNASLVNDVRGMLGYTGLYGGKKISVMGSGMGMPSIGIYSYELYTRYGVESIIRIGSAGGFSEKLDLYDVVLAQGACTDSAWAEQYGLTGTFAPIADFDLLTRAKNYADTLSIPCRVGNIVSTDVFYSADSDAWKKWAAMGVLAVEMECAALYMNAAHLQKKALAILTISDHFISGKATSPEEREKSLTAMIRIALNFAE